MRENRYLKDRLAALRHKREELNDEYNFCLEKGRVDNAILLREQISIVIHKIECTMERIALEERSYKRCEIFAEVFTIPSILNPKTQF
jgi:hypothetical protein